MASKEAQNAQTLLLAGKHCKTTPFIYPRDTQDSQRRLKEHFYRQTFSLVQ